MKVFALDCYPDPDRNPSVVMIVAAESEAEAVQLAFGHPNAAQYQAVQINPKRKKPKDAGTLDKGIHGFVNWKAYKAL